FAGMTFLLIADGLLEGQSPGKRLIGLQAVLPERGIPVTFRESILRNIPFAVALFCLLALPFFGWILAGLLVGIEALLVIGNFRGLRLGDEIAKSQVVEGASLTRPAHSPPAPAA
ncbi:MAG TPA: RDD family protein, partial [Nitrospiria bacterium]